MQDTYTTMDRGVDWTAILSWQPILISLIQYERPGSGSRGGRDGSARDCIERVGGEKDSLGYTAISTRSVTLVHQRPLHLTTVLSYTDNSFEDWKVEELILQE